VFWKYFDYEDANGDEDEEDLNKYKTILVTLDGTVTDRAIIEHVKPLAKWAGSCVALLHVADGWAARTYGADAISREIPRTGRIWRRSAPNVRRRG
jgi:hypothetical protein